VADFDVVIIGAGPAGIATAIKCCDAGLSVLIVESQAFPRHRPGESFHPGVEPLFHCLGVLNEINNLKPIRYSGYWVSRGGVREHVFFGSDNSGHWKGFQIWRADLDKILLDRATRAGCDVWQPCRANRPMVKDGRVVGVATENGHATSPFLIDASGGCHWLARHLDLQISHASPRLTAAYGYASSLIQKGEMLDPILNLDNGMWRWEARIDENTIHWCELSPARLNCKDSFLNRYPARRVDTTWRSVDASAGAGYFIVGDAAALMDPASSHGVLRALMSGIMVGHLVTSIFHGRSSEYSALFAYRHWLTAWFNADSAALLRIYTDRGLDLAMVDI
jgi:flavin-dependent dehydrogenase